MRRSGEAGLRSGVVGVAVLCGDGHARRIGAVLLDRRISGPETQMGQFMGIAQQIAAQLTDQGAEGSGLTRDDLIRQIGNAAGHAINCYPGDPTSACHSLAVFVSITAGYTGPMYAVQVRFSVAFVALDHRPPSLYPNR